MKSIVSDHIINLWYIDHVFVQFFKDSLGFSSEWDFEASATMNGIGADFKPQAENPAILTESKTKTLLSPAIRSTKPLSRERISTPIETSSENSPKLIGDIISPVFAANPINVNDFDDVIKNSDQMFEEENRNLETLAQGKQDTDTAEYVSGSLLTFFESCSELLSRKEQK